MENELRLFLSSTFRALQNEREALVKKVFPEIRRTCRERGIEFTEIDLRWGLTDEDASGGRIIRTCLEEIERSMPFFLGIIGDRYGWIPEPADYAKDEDLLNDHPWLAQLREERASITEIEFHYALTLCNNTYPDAIGTSLSIYQRDRSASKKLGAVDDVERLAVVARRLGSTVNSFKDPEELADKVKSELLAAIEVHWPSTEIIDRLSLERKQHEAFALSRLRSYVPDRSAPAALDRSLESENTLIVLGESGSGKSSLLAYFANAWSREHRPLIIQHYVGADSSAQQRYDILRRICDEIRHATGAEEAVSESDEELLATFPLWLSKLTVPTLIVMDAVNQLSGPAAELHWIPDFIPSNVKLVLSCTSDHYTKFLSQREWATFEVTPISSGTRHQIIKDFLGQYSKRLTPTQAKEIAGNEKCGNPLFLRVVLEELRLFNSHEELGQKIATLLASHDLNELFVRVLERIERDFGQVASTDLLSVIWAVPSGITEAEILGLARMNSWNVDRTMLSQFVSAFEYHLVRSGGNITFFHQYLTTAVQLRYCPTERGVTDLRKLLERFFASEPINSRVVELRGHMLEAIGEQDNLVTFLSSLENAIAFLRARQEYTLLRLWKSCESYTESTTSGGTITGFDLMDDRYTAMLEARAMITSAEDATDVLLICNFLRFASQPASARRIAERLAEQCRERELLDKAVEALLVVATSYIMQAEPHSARTVFDKILPMASQLHDIILKRKVDIEYLIALYETGAYFEAEPISARLVQSLEAEGRELDNDAIQARQKRADVLMELGRFDESEAELRKILSIELKKHGQTSPQVAVAKTELAGFLRRYKKEMAQEACQLLRESYAIFSAIVGERHRTTIMFGSNLASALGVAGYNDEAREWFLKILDIEYDVCGRENRQTATTLHNFAIFLRRLGKYDEAREYYEQAVKIFSNTLGSRHGQTALVYHSYATFFECVSDLSQAKAYYEQAAEAAEASFGKNHPQYLRSFAALVKTSRLLGDAEGALKRYEWLSAQNITEFTLAKKEYCQAMYEL
ncbi:MAG TPA: tetratricopeptide repeat protein, partial [Candidatus Kapabacteria bacterium]|nr:tetratricopeptide repeat protein [Candidatus Kapabacteria bacterium]